MKTLIAVIISAVLVSLAQAQDAQFRAGDQLDLRFGGVPSEEVNLVSGQYGVDSDGYINMPHVGKIKVAGLTQSQLQQTVENTYRSMEIYAAPTVTASVPGSGGLVNMGGDVRSPGRIPYTPDLTVLSAINASGGFTEYADQSKVRVLRGNEVIVINIKEIRKDPSKDIKLRPADSIEVPRSFW